MVLSFTLIGFAALTCCLYTVDAFDPYQISGIKPKCEAVSAPLCVSPTTGGSPTRGRNRRSLPDRMALDTTALGKARNKRRTRNSRRDVVEWRYNSTTFPNFANDETPDDVTESLRRLHPVIATQCSKFVNLFLCSVYSPVCTEFGVVPPCKELCDKVMSDCASTVKAFGIDWPDNLQCHLFPSNDTSGNTVNELAFIKGVTSLDDETGIVIQRAASLTWIEALVADGKICIPPNEDDVVTPQLELLAINIHQRPKENNKSEVHSKANHEYGLWCPAEMRSPPGQPGYSFLGMENCSPPCPNMYVTEGELSGIRYVIIFMSSLCIIVTFFTLCTFLIDTKRFRYPERPIVFYAFSYFIVSLIFLVGFILKEDVACNEEIRDKQTNVIIQGFTVVKGDHKQACTMLFMVLYYFTVNGTIWWLILTITWLLAAGFKWGTEAIEKYSMYYHAIAWGLPAVQTLFVVTFSKIEGDNIAGVCFLGLYDSEGLRYMLLTPLCIYLFVGLSILCAGFCCLNRVRIKLRDDEVNKRKLSKFMLRIGVFSVMYIAPQIILLALRIVEDSQRTQWEASWFLKACEDYRVPCPAEDSNVSVSAHGGDQQPRVAIFCIKYIMTLIVALPPLFWVASKKTLISWKGFFCRENIRPQSHIVTLNNNSNHPGTHVSSRKALIGDEPKSKKRTRNHKPRSLGDGGIERDEVFDGLEAAKLHGSSASVAAQARAAQERNSRQNEILQHEVDEPTPQPPASQTPPAGKDYSVRRKTELKKEFPEKRLHQRASSASTSSRVTSSLQRPSSSMSSSNSVQRRGHAKDHGLLDRKTFSLNRAEFKEKLARDLARTSPMTSRVLNSSKSNVAQTYPSIPRPTKPPRVSTSSRSNGPSTQRNFEQPAKNTVVAVMPEVSGENRVEV